MYQIFCQLVISKLTTEAILCLKDSNRKTREAAYRLILSLANASNSITEFIKIVVGALGAETTHMRSAAVMALSRIVFEFSRKDEEVENLLPHMLRTVMVLYEEYSREVIKSVLGFTRVSVAAMQANQLEPVLPELVNCLLKYHKGKGRFRAKIKIIVKHLVKKYGYDTLMPLFPESESRMLTHMRKLSERLARRKSNALNNRSNNQGKGQFDDMLDSDEDDSDDGRTLYTGVTGWTKKTSASRGGQSKATNKSWKTNVSDANNKSRNTLRIPRDKDGKVIDMLSSSIGSRLVENNNEDMSDSEDSGEIEFDESGRLLVKDDSTINIDTGGAAFFDDDEATNEDGNLVMDNKRQRTNKLENIQRQRNEKKKQITKLGSSYKSKKAGGDVIRKGQKFEPYAYVPLDGRNFSKRNRRSAVEQMETVVRSGKRKKR